MRKGNHAGILAAFALGFCFPLVQAAEASRIELGKRLYTYGVSVAGAPVRAISQGDVAMSGADVACVTCHRASGFGSSEGGYYVPPITQSILFVPRKLERVRLFPEMFQQVQPEKFSARLFQPHMRPAYTEETLRIALEKGVDAAGQPFAAIMPRYQLGDGDAKALFAYLEHLSVRPDPGVDKEQIHFATVFAGKVPAADRDAMLRTLNAYVDWHNEHLQFDRGRPNFSPYYRSDYTPLQRRWALSVWILQGAEDTWQAQLEALNRSEPAFAMVAGLGEGRWKPVAEFCDHYRIPYFFPGTELPVENGRGNAYTFYFSAGLMLEARVVGQYLNSGDVPVGSVVQLASTDAYGRLPAEVLRLAIASGKHGLRQQIISYRTEDEFSTALTSASIDDQTTLVIWPGSDIKASLDALFRANTSAMRIILPSRAISDAALAPESIARRLRFAYRCEINPARHPKSFEVRAWMRTRRIAIDRPTLQFETYYALSLIDAALESIREDFFREYLMERVEQESEKDLNPGIYPRLALGPGQRIASKGAYIARFDSTHAGTLVADSNWIVPQ